MAGGNRTISQIAGEFGLTRNATKDPFASQEKAVTEQIKRQLAEQQSRQLESASARGLGRSTFTEALLAQQSGDVLGRVGSEFAKARTQEALRENDFQRDIIRDQLGADIENRLIGDRGEQDRLTLTQQLLGGTKQIQERGNQDRQTLAQQIAGQERLAELSGNKDFQLQQERLNSAERIAELNREGQFGLQEGRIASEERLAELGREQQLQLQRERLDREGDLIGARGEQERQNIQLQGDYQQALQEMQLEFKGNQADIERQEFKNQQALDLALSGNLSPEDVKSQIGSILGEGAVLTPNEEIQLQRIASASGLSVEDYTRLRSAIGTAQAKNMFGTTVGKVQEKNENGEELYKMPSDKDLRGLKDYMPNTIKEKFKDRSKFTLAEVQEIESAIGNKENFIPSEVTGEISNLSNYIQDPEAMRNFQLELARIEADAQKQVAKEQSKSGKVLCSELYRQGKLPKHIYEADQRHARKINPFTVLGYHLWAKPLVKVMKKSTILTTALKPFIKAWAYHMAYKEKVVKKDNKLGLVLEKTGMPICYCLGRLCFNKKSKVPGVL